MIKISIHIQSTEEVAKDRLKRVKLKMERLLQDYIDMLTENNNDDSAIAMLDGMMLDYGNNGIQWLPNSNEL